ncbi:MAG: rod shape-determining protein MreD [Rhodanobacteraceae bacterium]|nr:rod shape-determining protein MreD [Rhodanobacteraceae bacterium]MBK7044151.1 rod shape-determining protein MreD [Rhodanobacteraceae bacterium]MBP9154401.1 rod shape-determining protein MreD [Xanthomonadales bacterium]HQW81600.1 rod shape-determining protein MreD [Pseudomonadota bacterium]
MSRSRALTAWLLLSIVLASVLTLIGLPEPLRVLRPFWLALIVIYWTIEAPEHYGIGFAFALGLLQDVLIGTMLGEHAFRLAIISFIVLRFRSRIRFFPMWQQALAVGALLLNDRIVVLLLRAIAGEFTIDWRYWLAPLVGAALWPWIFLLLDDLRSRSRQRDA